ncbi:MAG: hypothetical protein R2700_16095 [Solirubrobacterales bacterium]
MRLATFPATIFLACAAMLAAPAISPAASDFGSNLISPAGGSNGCGAPSCTQWNSVLHPSNTPGSLTAPISGVVVSFTLKKATASGPWSPLHLRVVREAPGGLWRGMAASSPDVVPSMASGLQTFSARVPISQGDFVGVEQDGMGTGTAAFYASASDVFFATPKYASPMLPADGSPASASTFDSREVLLRARVELDADHDGFGDETQDGCPSDASTHGSCPPPPPTSIEIDSSATPAKQSVGKLRVELVADGDGTLALGGEAKIALRKQTKTAKTKSYELKTKKGIGLQAGVEKVVRLKFRNNRKTIKRIEKRLQSSKRARKRSKVVVRLTATAAAGPSSSSRVKIKLKP